MKILTITQENENGVIETIKIDNSTDYKDLFIMTKNGNDSERGINICVDAELKTIRIGDLLTLSPEASRVLGEFISQVL